MIKNIIFDIGNVLSGFIWQEFYQSFGFDATTMEKLTAATVKGPLWYEIDQGNMSTAEIISGFKASEPSIAAEIEQVFANVSGMISQYEYAFPWFAELKARGYAVYIISNISEKIIQDCQADLTFLSLADGAILSYQEKMQKPAVAIYQRCLERFALKPEECIFLDDQQPNIIAAAASGIKGILFQNYPQARQELEDILA